MLRQVNQSESPVVTVIAACYNHSTFLSECLESIRGQTFKQTQLIITDDASTDDSLSLIKSWIARYSVDCLLLANDRNQGLCRTLNHALSYATGKYVAFIATDDIWLSEKLERQVAHMERLPNSVGVLYSDAYLIDEPGAPLPGMFIESHRHFDRLPEGDILDALLVCPFIPAMSTLIRTECFDQVGLFDESLAFEDYDFWLRVAARYEFAASPIPSAKYRLVHNSLVRTLGDRLTEGRLRIYKKWVGKSARIDQIIGPQIAECAYALYQKGYPGRRSLMRLRLKYDRSIDARAVYLLSGGGTLPWSYVRRLKAIATFVRSASRSVAGTGTGRVSS
jgi:glycosyltransferase involved in cell wall biosynthesis